jgi:hypothetical protein
LKGLFSNILQKAKNKKISTVYVSAQSYERAPFKGVSLQKILVRFIQNAENGNSQFGAQQLPGAWSIEMQMDFATPVADNCIVRSDLHSINLKPRDHPPTAAERHS